MILDNRDRVVPPDLIIADIEEVGSPGLDLVAAATR